MINTYSIKNAIFASFYADSLALPVHWIYDVKQIQLHFGELKELQSPKNNPYHGNKLAGEHTHYGDQALALFHSIVQNGTFKLEAFSHNWKKLFTGYQGYHDQATKTCLENFAQGKTQGANSTDLGGAARLTSLLLLAEKHTATEIKQFARAQTSLTHDNPLTVDTAELLTGLSLSLLEGVELEEAIEQAILETGSREFFKVAYEQAKAVLHLDPVNAIKSLGQACGISGALPSSFYLILKFPDNLLEALNQNCLAGGDSAARGLFTGMVLGAAHAEQLVWSELAKLKAFSMIEEGINVMLESGEKALIG